MKLAGLLFAIMFLSSAFADEIYQTRCKQGDCFVFGWLTTGPGYSLDTICKQGDCAKFGWSSLANDGSSYDVTCKTGGCFTAGWYSNELVADMNLKDEVTCKAGFCLVNGWTVLTGYDPMGGNVTCHQDDCSKFGGDSFWRGRPSQTQCYQEDCYHLGWTLNVN